MVSVASTFRCISKEMEFRFNHRRDDLFALIGAQLVRVLVAYPIRIRWGNKGPDPEMTNHPCQFCGLCISWLIRQIPSHNISEAPVP